MTILLNAGILILGFVLLIKGADWFVDGAAGIAKRMGISEMLVGLTIVAMGTSAPEVAVSLSSAVKGSASICLGNALGSNIMNILVILGITALFTRLPLSKESLKFELPIMIGATLFILMMGALEGRLDRVDGLILWCAFIAYLMKLFIPDYIKSREERKALKAKRAGDQNQKPAWKLALLLIIGIAMIVVGSDLTVDGATFLAKAIGISDRVIGLTIVALGTSLPELATSVVAARKGSADLAIGNIIGSNIFNLVFVIGTTALLVPIPFESGFIFDSIVAAAAAVVLFVVTIVRKRLGWKMGTLMLLMYIAYLVTLLMK